MARLGRIPEAEVERLKKEVDLVALVRSKGVELKDHGKDLVGCCPFHNDRSPSLVVSPEKNLWNCLGACGGGGSVIDWVMKSEGVSFRHALELIRSRDAKILLSPEMRAQNTVPKLPPPVAFDASDWELLDQVVGYYEERLLADAAAKAYLESRKVWSEEAIKKFRIGFADRTLGLRLPHNNRKDGEKIRSNLIRLGLYRESGHEHFNGSIVFPVVDGSGRVTEIYGRKITKGLRQGTPLHTYLPGPHKGVWNLEGTRFKEVILTESIIDALSFWCHGFKNVTASYGVNGFTDEMLKAFIENGVAKVFIAYDRDEAGDVAAGKLSKLLLSEGIESLRVKFPKGMDANAFVQKMDPPSQALKVALHSAEPMTHVKRSSIPVPAEEPSPAPATPVVVAGEVEELSSLPVQCDAPEPTDVPTVVAGEDILITLGDREYRVRGLAKNLSYEVMRVNLRVSVGLRYHVDLIDLYQAKSRTGFINASVSELGVKEEVIKRDLGRVLLKLETLQEEAIKAYLKKEPEEKKVTLSDAETTQALNYLKDPNLLKNILADFGKAGVIGEETNLLVGYLASISRKLEDPLAVVIQSSSAAGKSSLMEAILAMTPDEEKIKYSAMTGQSLFYMGETSLKNKILAIAEEEGARHAAYALKLLQSEGEIRIASTGKDPVSGRLITHEYRVEGPVMIFMTTTAIEVDEELLNRCVVLTVNEGREQTRAIHVYQRQSQTLEGLLKRKERSGILKLHQNVQRLLKPILVANPFAEKLSFLDHQTRTRRDHMKYLTLIRSIALLHQYQRETKKTVTRSGEVVDYIEVTVQDIETANRVSEHILGRNLEDLPPQTKRMLQVIDQQVKTAAKKRKTPRQDFRFTRKDVREWSGWSDFQVQTHIEKLTQLEYVASHRRAPGQAFLYELLWDESEATTTTAGLCLTASWS